MREKLNETIRQLACIWFGHSMIMTSFFGYHYCGRCGETLGDTLASIFPQGNSAVVIGHGCDMCKENYKNMTWKDKFLVPDPFEEEALEAVPPGFSQFLSNLFK